MIKSLLLFANILFANIHGERFENTNWVSKVSNKYVASINLRGNNYAVRYNKNSAQTFRGCYSVCKDTLIIKERDDSQQLPAYHRIKFVLKNNELHFFSIEEMVNHQWIKTKTGISSNTVFTRV